MAGVAPGDKEADKVRAVVYRDVDGAERGILVYTLEETDDYSAHDLSVRALFADGDDAYAALWRFAIEHDLVGKVKAWLQQRAPRRRCSGWCRSPRGDGDAHRPPLVARARCPGCLTSRGLRGAARGGRAGRRPARLRRRGRAVRIDEAGEAAVEAVAAGSPVDVDLSVGALGSLLLGGVRATELASAGLVRGEARTLAALDAAFAPRRPRCWTSGTDARS